MINKINIFKDKGPIVFLGSMNAMPMMYALELKKRGYDVIYLVDTDRKDTLSRPENHFSEISYPYPNWILEYKIYPKILLPLFKKTYTKNILNKIRGCTNRKIQLFVLNDFFISLADILPKESQKISLCHGSDLDTWANIYDIKILQNNFKNRSIFKYMPEFFSKKIIRYIVFSQFNGFKSSEAVVCFPSGLNEFGDKVVNELSFNNINIFERYDVSFSPLKNANRNFKKNTKKLIIFSGVRFLFETFTEGNKGYCKGNDIIIKGLSSYYHSTNKNIEIHFVEKGPDVSKAKKLCKDLGLEEVVSWHKEMPFFDLIKLYEKSDICLDQVGEHWMGAIGCYALWLGKPLIANVNNLIKTQVIPFDNPILNAKNEFEVCEKLIYLTDENNRHKISNESKKFAEKFLGPNKLLCELFDFD